MGIDTKQERIDFYKKQIAITLDIIQMIREDEPYKTVKLEVLRNRLATYKEELERLQPTINHNQLLTNWR